MHAPRLVTAVALFGILVGCGGGDGTSPPVPSQVRLTPTSVSFSSLGETAQMAAEVFDETGAVLTGQSPAWSSTNADVVSVSASGLVTATGPGSAQVRATVASVVGVAAVTVTQVASDLIKAAGDLQNGEVGQRLLVDPAVTVRDAGGSPIQGQSVQFQVLEGGGSLTASTVNTDAQGRASVGWTLGPTDGTPQRLRATSGSLTVEFTATAQLGALLIETTTLADARRTLPYARALTAVGGSGGGYVWSVATGSLPAGITLSGSGSLAGTATSEGTFAVTVRVTDSDQNTADRELSLRVCEAPLALNPGEWVVRNAAPAGDCGIFLPSGAQGDYYRLTAVWPVENFSTQTTSFTLRVLAGAGVMATGQAAAAVAAASADASRASLGALAGAPALPTGFRGMSRAALERDLEIMRATEAFHARVRADEVELFRTLGPDAVAEPRARPGGPFGAAAATSAAPDTVNLRFPDQTDVQGCMNAWTAFDAVLLAESPSMAFYQHVGQHDGSDSVSVADARAIVDYYDDYGKQITDTYFQGVSDLNGDGQIVAVAHPSVQGATAAFVWSGDFAARSACNGSDQQELVYVNAPGLVNLMSRPAPEDRSFQALATMVHEAKHVSSLYKRVRHASITGNNNPFHPIWIEEGTAEIAGEMATRLSWAATGGPAVGAEVGITHWQGGPTPENWGIFLRMARVVFNFAQQPNFVTAEGGPDVRGAGWLMHRFLGDAYGNPTPLGDQAIFRNQVDSTAAIGTAAFPALFGKTYEQLIEEFAIAATLEGSDFSPPRRFRTYAFPDGTEIFRCPDPPGFFPWPVTTVPFDQSFTCRPVGAPDPDLTADLARTFVSAVFTGSVGSGGIRAHDFRSNGTGEGATFVPEGATAIRVIIARLL